MADNPFEVLRLDPTAQEAEAVRQAAHLCQRATDESVRNVIRQAVRELTSSARIRELHALLTHPRPDYTVEALDRLVAHHRRAPVAGVRAACPPVDQGEVARLLLRALQDELQWTPLPLEAQRENESVEEMARQTSEALWQGFLIDPRA